MNPAKTKPRRERPVSAVLIDEASEETGLPAERILKMIRSYRLFGMHLGGAMYVSEAAIPLLEGEVKRQSKGGKK